MIESVQDYMRVGILQFMIFPDVAGGQGPVIDTLKYLLYDPFFDVVEVTQMADPAVRAEARALAEQAQCELVFGAQPMLLGGGHDLNHADDAVRAAAVDVVRSAVDHAADLGCPAVAVLSGKVSEDKDAARVRLIDSLSACCAYGAERGIEIELETFDQVPYGKNCLIGPTAEAVAVSAAVRDAYPGFGLILDSSHLPLQDEAFRDAIAAAGEHLVHAHMGNCAMDDSSHPAYGDNHPRIGAPGTRNGVAELAEYLRALLDSGYLSKERRPIVSFEVKPMPGESPHAVIAGSKRALLEAWRRV